MSSTSAIPVTHVPCPTEWPALSPSKMAAESDWEMLPDDSPAQTSFERDAVCIDEPVQNEVEVVKHTNKPDEKPLCLKHAHSTPDFHHYKTILEESYDDSGAVLVENYEEDENEDGVGSLASSSIVMVSGPSSVVSSQSVWSTSSKISFKDAIMKENQESNDQGSSETGSPKSPKTARKKPKFVVKPIKRCIKSTGDLQSLARIAENDDHDEDHILGDTDAQMYYNQKAQGKIGRKNGRKTRPDEAKRLAITMAKKEDQRQRQAAAKKK